MIEDILEELEEEILYASRMAWDSAQSGLNANFLGRVQDEIERLRAENENLRAALKPFAVEEQVIHRWYSSDVFPYVPDDHPVLSNKITVGDLRSAAAALKETGDE